MLIEAKKKLFLNDIVKKNSLSIIKEKDNSFVRIDLFDTYNLFNIESINVKLFWNRKKVALELMKLK